MKKILIPAACAIVMAFAATDASAQQKIGKSSSSDRPMPTNDEITRERDQPETDGKPFQQIRATESDSPRNRENMEIYTSEPEDRQSLQGDPAERMQMDKEKRREKMGNDAPAD